MSTALMYLFLTTSQTFNLPAGALSAMCYVESGHKIGAIHEHDGKTASIGICQIKLATARSLGFTGTAAQLRDPQINIFFSGKYLSLQIRRCGGLNAGFRAYNVGHCGRMTSYVDRVKLAMLEGR